MDAWEELADQMKLVEAEEAMGEDDGVLGGFCRGLDRIRQEMRRGHTVFAANVGVVILNCRTKV